MKSMIVFIFTVTFAHAAIKCPSSWTEYNTIRIGSYMYSSEIENGFKVNRKVKYQCDDHDVVQFNTTWVAENDLGDNYEIVGNILEVACLRCTNTRLKIAAYYRTRKKRPISGWYSWQSWVDRGIYSYLDKNCNILYWTNWIETKNCATSSQTTLRRSCADCNGEALEQIHCDATGHAVNETDCNHYWTNWTEEPCVTTGCKTVGKRVKTRKCLYGNEGQEATKVQLCSNSNESAIMTEECINTTIPDECVPQSSSKIGNADNMGFYVGIGVAVTLIVILCILLVVVRYRRLKATYMPPDNSTKPNLSYPYDFENFTVKTNKQLNDAARATEVSQQNPADTNKFANPRASANIRNFKGVKQAKLNKQEDKPVEEPVVYDFAQIDDSDPKTIEQASHHDVYEMATTDVSNAYEIETSDVLNAYEIETSDVSNASKIATLDDPNVYEIEDHPIQHAESNLSTAESIEGEPEHSNTYSSLQSSSDAVESTYSRLER